MSGTSQKITAHGKSSGLETLATKMVKCVVGEVVGISGSLNTHDRALLPCAITEPTTSNAPHKDSATTENSSPNWHHSIMRWTDVQGVSGESLPLTESFGSNAHDHGSLRWMFHGVVDIKKPFCHELI